MYAFCERGYAVIATPSEVHTSVRRIIDWRTRVVRDPDLNVNETWQVDKEKVNCYTLLGVIEANRRGNDRDSGRWIIVKMTRQETERERKKLLFDLVCLFLVIRAKICDWDEFHHTYRVISIRTTGRRLIGCERSFDVDLARKRHIYLTVDLLTLPRNFVLSCTPLCK